jgi:hypothetical protein
VIAVDLIPKDASHDLVVYFRTDKYPEEFCAIWDDLSGENQDEGIHLMRSSGTLVEYINERDGIQIQAILQQVYILNKKRKLFRGIFKTVMMVVLSMSRMKSMKLLIIWKGI